MGGCTYSNIQGETFRGILRLSLNGDPSTGQQVGSTGGTGQGSQTISALRVLTQICRYPFLKVPALSI